MPYFNGRRFTAVIYFLITLFTKPYFFPICVVYAPQCFLWKCFFWGDCIKHVSAVTADKKVTWSILLFSSLYSTVSEYSFFERSTSPQNSNIFLISLPTKVCSINSPKPSSLLRTCLQETASWSFRKKKENKYREARKWTLQFFFVGTVFKTHKVKRSPDLFYVFFARLFSARTLKTGEFFEKTVVISRNLYTVREFQKVSLQAFKRY